MDRYEAQEIKDWLAVKGKDRDWLAKQCHVSKTTVDGWLSAGRTIPKPALSILKDLMGGKTTLNPRISLTTFLGAQHLADEKGMTLTEWIEWLIDEEVRKLEKSGRTPMTNPPLTALPPIRPKPRKAE